MRFKQFAYPIQSILVSILLSASVLVWCRAIWTNADHLTRVELLSATFIAVLFLLLAIATLVIGRLVKRGHWHKKRFDELSHPNAFEQQEAHFEDACKTEGAAGRLALTVILLGLIIPTTLLLLGTISMIILKLTGAI